MVYKIRIGCTDYETEMKAWPHRWQGETLPPNFFYLRVSPDQSREPFPPTGLLGKQQSDQDSALGRAGGRQRRKLSPLPADP